MWSIISINQNIRVGGKSAIIITSLYSRHYHLRRNSSTAFDVIIWADWRNCSQCFMRICYFDKNNASIEASVPLASSCWLWHASLVDTHIIAALQWNDRHCTICVANIVASSRDICVKIGSTPAVTRTASFDKVIFHRGLLTLSINITSIADNIDAWSAQLRMMAAITYGLKIIAHFAPP